MQPKRKLKSGNILCSIWQNDGKEGRLYLSYQFQKAYKDQSGEWKYTEKYFSDDLMKLKAVIDKLVIETVQDKTEKTVSPVVDEKPQVTREQAKTMVEEIPF